MLAAGIPDPTKVVRSALQNAASIAALFLTTEAVVADKPEKSSPMGGDPRAAWAAWTSESTPTTRIPARPPSRDGGLALSRPADGQCWRLRGEVSPVQCRFHRPAGETDSAVTACARGSGGAGAGADGGGAARAVEPGGQGRDRDRLAFIWVYAVASAALGARRGGLGRRPDDRPEWVWLGAAAVTAVLHIGYQLALQRGYAEGDLNLVYPLARGTGPLLTFVVAVGLLGERPGVVAAWGCCWWWPGCWSSRGPAGDPRQSWPGVAGAGDGRRHRGVHGLGQPCRHRPRGAAGAVLRAGPRSRCRR